MSHQLDVQKLEFAFQGRPDIIGAIQKAAAAPNWIELFNEISLYVSNLQASASSEPASKRRKVEQKLSISPASNGRNGVGYEDDSAATSDNGPAFLQIKDVSLVIPQRKKYVLEFTSSGIRARHPETNELIPGISYAWKDIAYTFCLPVPDKAQKQYNYAIFLKQSNPSASSSPTLDPLVFTIPATAPKPGIISGPDSGDASSVSDDYKTLFDWAISRYLKTAGNSGSIVEADPKQFASVMKEAHRPTEKALFVKGFRGSKDGYLFFLKIGILWGFKKPLIFLPKERIAAVSYTSVLQRTFNLNVEVYITSGKSNEANDEEEKEEYEFAMLDQEDFAGIDTYVKRHGLQDASMAEQRRAKRLGINVVKNENGEKVDVGDASELQKAEQELQDEEDEEEEDYDPGSEGESEGEGTSSEEDEDGDDRGGDEGEVEGVEEDEDEDEEEDLEEDLEEEE